MVEASDPLVWYDLADHLKTCVLERLNPGVLSACVVTGEIAWDNCECGELRVAIQQRYPSSQFPNEGTADATQPPCGAPLWVGGLAVSILRCAPGGGPDEDPPTCDELAAAAQQSVLDASAVENGLWCCLRTMQDSRDIANFQIGTTTFVGAQGMCQGSVTQLFVGLVGGCRPCDGES